MKTGIVVVAFGHDYERLALQALTYSRKFTDLPFHVMLGGNDGSRFDAIKEVSYTCFNRNQNENRKVKLRLDEVTPFDLTLYMDCDSVIQRPGVEQFINLLDGVEMVFNPRITFNPGQPIWNIYARCMKQFGIGKPISIHNGGIFAFRKTPVTGEFFKEWYRMWIEFGSGREMPPLNCAIKKTGIAFNAFQPGFFADSFMTDDVVVQHCWHISSFSEKFGITPWTENKPFDKGKHDDFRYEVYP